MPPLPEIPALSDNDYIGDGSSETVIKMQHHPGCKALEKYGHLFMKPAVFLQRYVFGYLSVPCLCMGELQAPPAPHFVFLITL